MTILNDFEKIAIKNKRKNRLKTVIISVSVMLISALIIFLGLRSLTARHAEVIKEQYLVRSEIAYPNINYTTWGFDATSEFTGTFYSHRSKNIDGINVPFEKYQGNYSLIRPMSVSQNEGLEEGDSNSSNYTHGNLYKVPIFYNINVSANTTIMTVTQDISKVKEMTGQAVEVAITFDKPYTYQEIKEMVPKNLLVNWYWIGTSSSLETANLNVSDQLGFAPSDDYAASFKLFKSNLKKAIQLGYLGSQYGTGDAKLSLEDDAKDYLKKNSNAKTATFSGVILTGRAENFAQLEDKGWIYASNIGQSVTVQPYHTLTK